MTLKIFVLKVRFLISPKLGRPSFAKSTNLIALTNLTSNRYSVPLGSREDLNTRPEGPSLRMDSWDGMGWMDGISKVSFNFVYPPKKQCVLAFLIGSK